MPCADLRFDDHAVWSSACGVCREADGEGSGEGEKAGRQDAHNVAPGEDSGRRHADCRWTPIIVHVFDSRQLGARGVDSAVIMTAAVACAAAVPRACQWWRPRAYGWCGILTAGEQRGHANHYSPPPWESQIYASSTNQKRNAHPADESHNVTTGWRGDRLALAIASAS